MIYFCLFGGIFKKKNCVPWRQLLTTEEQGGCDVVYICPTVITAISVFFLFYVSQYDCVIQIMQRTMAVCGLLYGEKSAVGARRSALWRMSMITETEPSLCSLSDSNIAGRQANGTRCGLTNVCVRMMFDTQVWMGKMSTESDSALPR